MKNFVNPMFWEYPRIHRFPLAFFIWLGSFYQIGLGQFPGWIYYTAGNRISCLARDGNTIWAGAWGGLISVDRTTGIQTCYNHANSGLPDNCVYSIAVDPSGVKWIGTSQRGLAKYDGVNWTYYNTSNSGIPSNAVTSIAIDAAGNKWIGTQAYGGLAKFNGTSWVVYNTSNSGISSNQIRAVMIDAAGVKWISTEAGISKFDGTTWTVYNTSNSGIPSNNVNFIAEDVNGNKWVSLWYSGVAKFDGSTWTLYTYANTGAQLGATTTISVDQSGIKWIGTQTSGLIKYDNTTWTTYNKSNSGIICNEVRYTLIDEAGTKWVGMGTDNSGAAVGSEPGGLQKFSGAAWTVCNTSNSPIPDDISECIAIESNGAKWIGTSQGLAKYYMNSWTTYNTSNSPIPFDYINQLKIDNSGNKWIGFSTYGIGKFNNSTWTFYTTLNSGLPSDFVTALTIGFNNVIWIGTSAGLARYNGTTWTVYNTGNSGLPGNFVSYLAADASGNVWISIDGFGLTKFDGSVWTQYNTSNSGLPTNSIQKLAFDKNNNLWAGTSSSGLCKFNGATWSVYTTSNSGIPNNYIGGAIAADCSGHIWFGSSPMNNGGLTKFDGLTWTTYNMTNSGMSGWPREIAFDESGNKWITTYNGLAEFHEVGINNTIISGVTSTNITCYAANNGTISILASGGTGTLKYSTDNGATWYQNGGQFTSLIPGSYNILVKDSCSVVSVYCDNPVILTQPPAIVISGVVSTNVTCHGYANGTITISAAGGTGVSAYSIDNGNSWQSNSGFYSGLSYGSYYIKVMDTSGCFVSYSGNPVIIMEPEAIAISSVETTNVTLVGGSDGSIKITASGGTLPLQYSINNGLTWQDSSFFPGLSAGDYYILIKDTQDCQISWWQNPVKILQPSVGLSEVSDTNTDAVYPNPFTDNLFLKVFISGETLINLSVFNGQGKIMYSLSKQYSESGNYLIPFSGVTFKPGAYYYRIEIKDRILTGKIVKMP